MKVIVPIVVLITLIFIGLISSHKKSNSNNTVRRDNIIIYRDALHLILTSPPREEGIFFIEDSAGITVYDKRDTARLIDIYTKN
jgi:hypothetical protein